MSVCVCVHARVCEAFTCVWVLGGGWYPILLPHAYTCVYMLPHAYMPMSIVYSFIRVWVLEGGWHPIVLPHARVRRPCADDFAPS